MIKGLNLQISDDCLFIFDSKTSPLRLAINKAKEFKTLPDITIFTFHFPQQADVLLLNPVSLFKNIHILTETKHRNDLGWRIKAAQKGIKITPLLNHSKIIYLHSDSEYIIWLTSKNLVATNSTTDFTLQISGETAKQIITAMNEVIRTPEPELATPALSLGQHA